MACGFAEHFNSCGRKDKQLVCMTYRNLRRKHRQTTMQGKAHVPVLLFLAWQPESITTCSLFARAGHRHLRKNSHRGVILILLDGYYRYCAQGGKLPVCLSAIDVTCSFDGDFAWINCAPQLTAKCTWPLHPIGRSTAMGRQQAAPCNWGSLNEAPWGW